MNKTETNKNANLNVVFADTLAITPEQVITSLQKFHPEFARARIGTGIPALSEEEGIFLEIICDNHKVRVFGVDAPVPDAVIQTCVMPAHYDSAFKEQIINHQSHIILFYENNNTPMLEQYAVLTAIAAALVPLGAIGVLNETAHTSFPAQFLISPSDANTDRMEYIRAIPLLILYCGLVHYQLESGEQWSRTYGAEKFNLPNLAVRITDAINNLNVFSFFSSILDYCAQDGNLPQPGHTSEYEGYHFTIRSPHGNEYYFQDEEGQVLVFEPMYVV